MEKENLFKWRHYQLELILLTVSLVESSELKKYFM